MKFVQRFFHFVLCFFIRFWFCFVLKHVKFSLYSVYDKAIAPEHIFPFGVVKPIWVNPPSFRQCTEVSLHSLCVWF